MKNRFKVIIIAGLMVPVALQAWQHAASSADPSAPGIESGSILYAELSKTLDAKKAKAGDPVNAVLLADVLSHGKIVAHHDAKLIGHVTEANQRTKESPESRLGIVFDKVILKGGQELPVHSRLLAIRPAERQQIAEAPSGPSHIGVNPLDTPPPDKHYPIPKGPTPRMNTSMNGELKTRDQQMNGVGETDI